MSYKSRRERFKDITPYYSCCEEEHEVAGVTIKVELVRDEHMGKPWEEHDGHGPVRESSNEAKAPGERLMYSNRGSYYFYDMREANALAKHDGWGCPHTHSMEDLKKFGGHVTKGEMRACAVEDDFKHMCGWLNDEWEWVGVVVTLFDEDENEIASDALWGIESPSYADDNSYVNETARGMAASLLTTYRKEERIRKLSERGLIADLIGAPV